MKKILIVILLVIIGIFGYNQYKDYQRYHSPNANYKISENIDTNYHNKSILFDYYKAVEGLNGYAIMQWSANGIDVKNPENDNEKTQYAVNEYRNKLAQIKYYEDILENSLKFKNKGLSNQQIKELETEGISAEAKEKKIAAETYKKIMISSLPKQSIRLGSKSAFIYELQKLLVKKGYEIPIDGVYKNITSDALKNFEEKNQLLPDGQIDLFSLEKLLYK